MEAEGEDLGLGPTVDFESHNGNTKKIRDLLESLESLPTEERGKKHAACFFLLLKFTRVFDREILGAQRVAVKRRIKKIGIDSVFDHVWINQQKYIRQLLEARSELEELFKKCVAFVENGVVTKPDWVPNA